jgi:hypothetical protein
MHRILETIGAVQGTDGPWRLGFRCLRLGLRVTAQQGCEEWGCEERVR